MSTKIQRLPDILINQIAAGEVVENPSSIVKELIENALDAGAQNIQVETLGGGHQLIAVHDDGCGMNSEEAFLSLERHATSKLKAFEDFESLSTMGFRGEALPSIASVSRLILQTAPENGNGTLLEVEGGKIVREEPCARNTGTSVEVRSLFYNTPARRKFQKNASISSSDILRTLTLLTLAHPERNFSLVQQEKLQLEVTHTPGDTFLTNLKKRLETLLGEPFHKDLIEISSSDEICKIEGFLAPLRQTRPNRKEQYLFINQRPVFSPFLSFAIKEALGTRIEENKFPLFVLHLSLPGHLVDVNVHPQKKEVRLREERYLKQFIQKALSEALGVFLPSNAFVEVSESGIDWQHLERSISVETARTEIPASFMRLKQHSYSPSLIQTPTVYRTLGLYDHFLLIDARDLAGTFSTSQRGIFFLNLFKAEAFIRYEKIKIRGKADKQALLFPLSLSFSLTEMARVCEHVEALDQMGFELREAGKNVFLLEALPSFIEAEDAKTLIDALLHAWEDPYVSQEELFKKLCDFPLRSKKSFVIEQAEAILKELLSMKNYHPLFNLLEHERIYALNEK